MERKLENIDNLFREGLGSYTELPPPSVWDALEERLDKDKKRPGFFYRWSWFILLLAFFGAGGAAFFAWKTAGNGNSAASQPIAANDASQLQHATTPNTDRDAANTATTGKNETAVTAAPVVSTVKKTARVHNNVAAIAANTTGGVTTLANAANNTPVAEKTVRVGKPVNMDQAIALNGAPAGDGVVNDVPQPTKTAVIKYIVKNSTHNNIAVAESEPVFVNVRETKTDNLLSNPVEDDEDDMTFGGTAGKAKSTVAGQPASQHIRNYSSPAQATNRRISKSIAAITTNNPNKHARLIPVTVNKEGAHSAHKETANSNTNSATAATSPTTKAEGKAAKATLASTTKTNSDGVAANNGATAGLRKHSAPIVATKAIAAVVEKNEKSDVLVPAAKADKIAEKLIAGVEKPQQKDKVERVNTQSNTQASARRQAALKPHTYAAAIPKVPATNVAANTAKRTIPVVGRKASGSMAIASRKTNSSQLLAANSAMVVKGNDIAPLPVKTRANAAKKTHSTKIAPAKAVALKEPTRAKKHTTTAAIKSVAEENVVTNATPSAKASKTAKHKAVGVASRSAKTKNSVTPAQKPALAASKAKKQQGTTAGAATKVETKKVEPALALVTAAATTKPVVPQASPEAPKVAAVPKKDSTPALHEAASTPASQNDSVVNKPKRTFLGFEVGIKAGYEGSFAAGGAKKFVITPFLEKKLSSKFSLLLQPGIKYAGLSSHKLSGTAAYVDADDNSTTYKNDSFILVDNNGVVVGWFHYDTAIQNHTSVVKSYAVSGSYLEFDFPVLLKYNITNKLSVYGGANITYSKRIGINELTTRGTTTSVTADTTYFTLGNQVAVHPLANSYMTYAGTPLSGYKGPLYPSPTGGAFRLGYTFGFSYQFNKRWLADVLVQQASMKANVQGGYNINTALSQNYFRFTLGYKLFQ